MGGFRKERAKCVWNKTDLTSFAAPDPFFFFEEKF